MKNLKSLIIASTVLLYFIVTPLAFSSAHVCSDGMCLGEVVTIVCDGVDDPCYGTNKSDVICVTAPVEVFALNGVDKICVESVSSVTHGGNGDDYILVLNGGGAHLGDNGDDTLVSNGPDMALLYGNRGDDVLRGANVDDTLAGGKGNDYCETSVDSATFYDCEEIVVVPVISN